MAFPAPIYVQGVLLQNFVDSDRTTMNGRVLTWMAFEALLPREDRSRVEYNRGYGLLDIAKVLAVRGFGYVEIEKPPNSPSAHFPGDFAWIGGVTGASYTRFSLSKSGDPACAQYEVEAANDRKYGGKEIVLPLGECVAARGVPTSESRYAIKITELRDEPTGRDPIAEPPAEWRIIDVGTKTTYAQMYRREAYYSHSCPAWPLRERFYDVIQPAKMLEIAR